MNRKDPEPSSSTRKTSSTIAPAVGAFSVSQRPTFGNPESSYSTYQSSNTIAPAVGACSASQRQTLGNATNSARNDQAKVYVKLPPRPPKSNSKTGSTSSSSNNADDSPSSASDIYFITPEQLSQSSAMSLQRGGGYQRPSNPKTAASIRRLEGWKQKRNTRASNEYLNDEFQEGAIIIYNQTNINMKLFRKPLGTYLIHKGPTNTDNSPYTIHAIQDSKKYNTPQANRIEILYNPERNCYYADNLGNNYPSSTYPSLRSLMDGNRLIFKYENYER